MASSKIHLTPGEMIHRHQKKVWYGKPRDRDFEYKGLIKFITEVRKKCDKRLVHFDCSIIIFDELIKKYERVTVDFITHEVVKNTGLAQVYFEMDKTNTHSDTGDVVFVKTPSL